MEPPYEELHVRTFHSFCERLLRDEAPEAGLAPGFAAVSRADRVALLLEQPRRAEPAPPRDPRQPGAAAGRVRVADRPAEGGDGLATSRWPRHAEAAPDGVATPSAAARRARAGVRALYADHDALLGERGALDAGDLVLRAFRLLHESPHVRERTAERFAARAGGRLPGRDLRPGHAAGAAVRTEHGARSRRPAPGAGAGPSFRARVPRGERWSSCARAGAAPRDRSRPRRRAGSGEARPEAATGGACASGAARPSAPRRRPWRPSASGCWPPAARPSAIAVLVRSLAERRPGGRRRRSRSGRCRSG